jgi:hypothetical protein
MDLTFRLVDFDAAKFGKWYQLFGAVCCNHHQGIQNVSEQLGLLPPSSWSTLKMTAADSSETLYIIFQITRHHTS